MQLFQALKKIAVGFKLEVNVCLPIIESGWIRCMHYH